VSGTGKSGEVALVDAARRGDRKAFAALVEAHYPQLLAVCRGMVGRGDLAADAAQEAVLTAMLALDRLRQADRFGPWLVGIGLNFCRRLLREQCRDPISLDDLFGGAQGVEPPDAGPGPAEVAESRALAARVRAAVATLPPGQRVAVVLFYLSGLTQAETAQHLGTATSSVKTRLHKARTALRHELVDLREDHVTTETWNRVPLRITDVRRLATGDGSPARHVVVLEDVDGGHRLPIWVGPMEAAVMALGVEAVELPRPSTYQFVAALLHGAGTQVREVRITRLSDAVFYAEAVLEDGTTVDARPSDALNLALVADLPIFAEQAVFDAVAGSEAQEWIAEAVQTGDDAHDIAQEMTALLAAHRPAR
jgi:RNA polymerase sigma factor (sigma-70 family)